MRMQDFTWKFHKISTGFTYHYIDQAPCDGVEKCGTVICFHGFPDFAYGWRYQIEELTKRGYRVIAPDQLGCGGTDSPDGHHDKVPYTTRAAGNAAIEILKHEGVKGKISVLGHDWGGLIAWRFFETYTDRVACFVSLCTPPSPAAQKGEDPPDLRKVVEKYPTFGYQLWLSSDEAEEKIKKNIREFIMLAFWNTWSPKREIDDGKWAFEGEMEKLFDENLEKLKKAEIPAEELKEYVEVFQKRGISGALNFYKTRLQNYKEDIELGLPQKFPGGPQCLLLTAENDGALPPSMVTPELLHFLFPHGNIKQKLMKNADHWLLQDDRVRGEVVTTVADFLDSQVCGVEKTSSRQVYMQQEV
ncbi:putative epoxide hydrolase with esterase/lipase super-family domain [Melampsora americana]|nr:putative epoxide hydrolase with esterase/lipase super-family domain [Melampsora americana]